MYDGLFAERRGHAATGAVAGVTAAGAFREGAHDEPALAAVAARIERVCELTLRHEKFVTALRAEADPAGTATFVNHGDPPPFLVSGAGSRRSLLLRARAVRPAPRPDVATAAGPLP
ncbi:SpoIIE family protein phosphatase [Streptomyces sp. NPDC048361]|uniref:SpoIIE family protein phosphatase n=1 Tax=Streptomyces sp. NPDC048361 TaxID=3154720 RepID=UPI003429FB3F